jgi:2-polyprenyl-6-hydroxyphenyl methylase/3-demethylubiquinone-9 3-methyltransferase
MDAMNTPAPASSVRPDDVERFSRIAAQWWDPRGKFAPLHKFNPVRLAFIREEALRAFGRDPGARRPFEGLRLLDIGCGGGLLSEPMARLGFDVTAVDASAQNIAVASLHAAESGLEINFRAGAAEDLLAAGVEGFDLVLNMEVIEHVADPERFLLDVLTLVRPGGVMILATLNRTLKSLAMAKIGAEYILGWLPRGAHDWRRFLKPEEIRAFLKGQPAVVEGPFGVVYDPLRDRWSEGSDVAINYLMVIRRPGPSTTPTIAA